MTLSSKIAAASKDVGGKLSADKTNKDQGYDYLSADKILTVCGQALAGQGVALFPAIMEMSAETVTYLKTWKGGSEEKTRYDARVQFLMKLSDGEDTQDLLWYGLGSDYAVPDKAVYKAITSGHKYFLMKLLNVGAGNEDGEHEASEEVKVIKQPSQQRPQSSGQVWPVAGVSSNGNGAKSATKHEPPAQRPWSAPDTIAMIRAKAEYNTKRDVGVPVTDGKLGALIGLMDSKPWNTDDRHNFLNAAFGATSTKAITDAQRAALVQWANPMKTGPEKEAPWAWEANAQQEYAAVVKVNRSFLSDAELDGTDLDPAVAGEGDEEPNF